MMTIQRRLLFLLVPALAVLMILGGVADYQIAVATTRNAYDRALGGTAFGLAAYLSTADGKLRFASASPRMSIVLRDGSDATMYAVRDSQGELLAGSPQLPIESLGSGSPAFRDAELLGKDWRIATLVVPTEAGTARISVAETIEKRAATQHVMLLGKLLVDFAELDVILFLIWIGVYYGLRPLGKLRAQVEARSSREWRRFDETDVPGEVRPLVVAFNRLLELLHEAALSQHRFVADAAHQMRTPVAGLLAQLELMLQDPAADPIKKQLGSINRGVQHLAHSANQLLSLARAEPLSASPKNFQFVPLQPLVEQWVERSIDRADKTGIDLGADARAANVNADAWLLDDVLSNLIDNALKYTPRGGRVTVRSGLQDGIPFLEVEDDGPGIPESERRRVRERFYRRPGSVGLGTGLGLAIVEEIARVHQATFVIETGAGGRGTRMQVRFSGEAPL